MADLSGKVLFSERDLWAHYMPERLEKAIVALFSMSLAEVARYTPTQQADMISYRFRVHVPILKRDRVEVSTRATGDGHFLDLTIPFSGDSSLFRVRPRTGGQQEPLRGVVSMHRLHLGVALASPSESSLITRVSEILAAIEDQLLCLQEDAGIFSNELYLRLIGAAQRRDAFNSNAAETLLIRLSGAAPEGGKT